MKFVSNVCPKCGAEIFSDAAEGLCTACLLETGLGLIYGSLQPTLRRPRRVQTNLCASTIMSPERGDGAPS